MQKIDYVLCNKTNQLLVNAIITFSFMFHTRLDHKSYSEFMGLITDQNVSISLFNISQIISIFLFKFVRKNLS